MKPVASLWMSSIPDPQSDTVLVIGKPLIYFDSLALSLEHMYSITKSEPKLIRAFKGLKVSDQDPKKPS